MKSIFQVKAPDGTIEFISPKGEVLTREEAMREPFVGTQDETEDEQTRRLARWSARGDCFVRESQIVPV